ncbi:hypothetical protein QR680_011472 [Steinernema hermaphroditum]|uniref:Uncharacterized protein n=1 Tax=Steinernema hermaphroditum TaxID=289476 RepID=A0AA39LZ12_9BILA|nr:hypothetical protein QR680_011472 [Steinernema hermaphroditum]
MELVPVVLFFAVLISTVHSSTSVVRTYRLKPSTSDAITDQRVPINKDDNWELVSEVRHGYYPMLDEKLKKNYLGKIIKLLGFDPNTPFPIGTRSARTKTDPKSNERFKSIWEDIKERLGFGPSTYTSHGTASVTIL